MAVSGGLLGLGLHVPQTGALAPFSGILIYEMSFWDTSTEVVAGLRETAGVPRESNVFWLGPAMQLRAPGDCHGDFK